MISIVNVSKKFSKLQVLRETSVEFNRSECVALIGPNGCGKTTLIKSILGMAIPDSGDIRVCGQPVKNSYLYRNTIGYMPQIGMYPENMSIGQVIEMIKSIRNNNKALDEELFHAFKLKEMYDKKMSTLSGGTTQKVSATLAFLFNPEILILDEPTAGLDPLAAEILKEKINIEKRKGKLIIITSHLLSELDEMVDKVVYMQDGTIKFNKETHLLKNETNMNTLAKAITHILKTNRNE